MRLLRTLIPLLAASLSLAVPEDARACGGGVFVSYDPASEPEQIVVAGHRIAISISDMQTIAWTQIHYQGTPREFAWVLPVIKDSKVQLADEAFLEALDAFTSTEIRPNVLCANVHDEGGGGGGCGIGCGSATKAGGDLGGGDPATTLPPVTIEYQASIGPFETVTLSAPDGDTVRTWLIGHGYPVNAAMLPVMNDYASKGLSFAALRLKSDAKTSDMKPVRVVMPARVELTAIRMMLAGTGSTVPITLFVLADDVFTPVNFPRVTVDDSKLEWDFTPNTSNYPALRAQALSSGKGDGWLASYVGRPFDHGSASKITVDSASKQWRLDDLYFALAASRAKKPDPCASRASRFDACDGHDDVAAAVRGLKAPRLVRLEMNLPRAAFDRDLDLQKSKELGDPATFALQVHTPAINKNVPCADYRLGDAGPYALGERNRPKLATAWLLAASVPALGALRRALRRKRSRTISD